MGSPKGEEGREAADTEFVWSNLITISHSYLFICSLDSFGHCKVSELRLRPRIVYGWI